MARNKQRKRGSSPTLVLWNNALINALSTHTYESALADPRWWGRLVENAVGAGLCNTLRSMEYTVTYWREGRSEVDYVVSRGEAVWAIEVKSGARGRTSGWSAFTRRYPNARRLIIGAQGIPLEEFFSRDPKGWFAHP